MNIYAPKRELALRPSYCRHKMRRFRNTTYFTVLFRYSHFLSLLWSDGQIKVHSIIYKTSKSKELCFCSRHNQEGSPDARVVHKISTWLVMWFNLLRTKVILYVTPHTSLWLVSWKFFVMQWITQSSLTFLPARDFNHEWRLLFCNATCATEGDFALSFTYAWIQPLPSTIKIDYLGQVELAIFSFRKCSAVLWKRNFLCNSRIDDKSDKISLR